MAFDTKVLRGSLRSSPPYPTEIARKVRKGFRKARKVVEEIPKESWEFFLQPHGIDSVANKLLESATQQTSNRVSNAGNKCFGSQIVQARNSRI